MKLPEQQSRKRKLSSGFCPWVSLIAAFFAGGKVGTAHMPDENKDIQIDSAFLGVEGTAWYLSQAAKHRFGVE